MNRRRDEMKGKDKLKSGISIHKIVAEFRERFARKKRGYIPHIHDKYISETGQGEYIQV